MNIARIDKKLLKMAENGYPMAGINCEMPANDCKKL